VLVLKLFTRRFFGQESIVNNSITDEKEESTPTLEQQKKYEQKRHKKHDLHVLEGVEDPYEVLGLGDLRWRSSDDQIRQAYKKLVLKYHPDKNQDIDDAIFKKIQTANEVLSDPKKRRIFDSQDEADFDFSIPNFNSQSDPTSKFYTPFGKVFDHISRWSTERPVPLFGNDETAYDEVRIFYDFWFNFKSWRDFSFEDEFNPNEAESREEKRWMERQNERERKKKKKEEAARIIRLTETAEKQDPRVKRYKEEQQKLKQEKKLQLKEEKRRKLEEQKKKEEEENQQKLLEEQKKQQELAEQKKVRAAENKKLQQIRSKLRQVCFETIENKSIEGFSSLSDQVETLCAALSFEKLSDLVSVLQQQPERAKEAFLIEINFLNKKEQESQMKKKKMKMVKIPSQNGAKRNYHFLQKG